MTETRMILDGVELPYPPSVNNYWVSGRNRHTGQHMKYLTARARTFKQAVGLLCGRRQPFTGRVGVRVLVWPPDRRTRSDLFPLLRRLHCSLNGVKLSRTQAGIAKGQGMLRGVPDLFLPVPRGNYAGLYIEMKHGDNKPTPEQARFLQESVDCGYQAAVCWSAAEAIAVIKTYYGVSE